MKAALGKYELFLVLSGAIWGTSFVTTKIGLGSLDPLYFALLRFALGAAVMVIAVLALNRFDPKVLWDPLVIFNSIISALAFGLQNIGMTMTTATNSALLININVGIVAILAAIILKEEITRRILYGIVVGMVGVVVISTNGDVSAIYSGSFLGNLLVFGAGLLWAFYIVYMKRTLDRQPDVLMVSTAIILETAVFLVPLTLLFAHDYTISETGLWTILYTGILCTGVAYLLYNAGLQRVKASISSVILLMELFFAMVFAVLILSEMPTSATAMGGGMILLSIGMISFANGNGRKH